MRLKKSKEKSVLETTYGVRSAATNPFFLMRDLLLGSLGRIPAGLTVLLIVSLTMASITAVILRVTHKPSKSYVFMEQRLAPDSTASPLDPYVVEGTWALQTDTYAMSIVLKNNFFEWLVRMGDDPRVVLFARGNYKIVGDVLVLGLRTDMGRPLTKASDGTAYIEIGMKDINLHAVADKSQMVWTVPVSEQMDVNTRIMSVFDKRTPAVFQWNRL